VSLSRKQKKELRRLQSDAQKLWESQQVLVGDAAALARSAGQRLGDYGRTEVLPAVQAKYRRHVAPVVDRGVQISKDVVDRRVVPVVGGAIGSALAAWDVANDKRRTIRWMPDYTPPAPARRGASVGSVIAVILGAAAAVGVVWAAWQALRADDELWVADDPLGSPEA